MTSVAKKGLTLLVIAFAGFYLLTQPQDAAGAVKGAVTAIGDALKLMKSGRAGAAKKVLEEAARKAADQ